MIELDYTCTDSPANVLQMEFEEWLRAFLCMFDNLLTDVKSWAPAIVAFHSLKVK
jgi:hypothetical protein